MKRTSLFIIIISFFITSCGSNKKEEAKLSTDEKLIIISEEQFKADNMAFGEMQEISFSELIKCNGNIVSKPSGIAKISPTVSCLVKNIYCTSGQKVNAGQILFKLSGNEFLDLQKDFSETASQLKRIESEYERIKSLYNDSIGTKKDLISSESEYKSINAKYSALKIKIKLIGLDVSKVENSNFYQTFLIKSPIDGYISKINVSIGQNIDQQTNMAEVLDIKQLQLQISLYEKDINKLNIGQQINFKLSSNNDNIYTAKLVSIGRTVNPDSKTIECYADIDDLDSGNFVNNAYIEADIIYKTEIAKAVPEESILKINDANYVLAFIKKHNNSYYLKSLEVKIGRSSSGYVEILKQLSYSKLLSKGTYNIIID